VYYDLVPYQILTRCGLDLYGRTLSVYIEKLRKDEGGCVKPDPTWCGVRVSVAVSSLTRPGAVLELVLPLKPVNDRSAENDPVRCSVRVGFVTQAG
jgi:hypothetical protein